MERVAIERKIINAQTEINRLSQLLRCMPNIAHFDRQREVMETNLAGYESENKTLIGVLSDY